MSVIEAIDTKSAERRTLSDVAREFGFVFEQRAMETADEDKFVADNFALLKTSGLFEAGVPAELGGGGADIDELAHMLRTLGASLRIDRAGVFHAHPSGRHSGLALDPSKGRSRRTVAETGRGGAHPAGLQRRVGLDFGIRQGREGRRRLPHHRAKSVLVGRADRRPVDDQRGAAKRRRAADGAAFRHPDELAARQSAGQLAYAGHARHRVA